MNPRILALGSVNVDFQLRIDRWPEANETLLGHDFLMIGGGKSANVAWLASHLGLDAQLIAHIGSDALQEIALKTLREKKVDLSTVRTVETLATGVSLILVPEDGQKAIFLASNANDSWTEKDEELVRVTLESAPPGSLLVTNLEIPVAIVKHAIRLADQQGIPVVLDPSPANRLDQELLEASCFLTPDQSEAQQLAHTSIDSEDQALTVAGRLRSFGNKGVCLKLKNGGCAAVSPDTEFVVHAPSVQAIDTTGAGDAFAGGFGVALLEHLSFFQAVRFAVAASTHAVTGYGSQPSYPNRQQIETLLRAPEMQPGVF